MVNFRVDPIVMRRSLPHGFEPKLLDGYAVGGICLIRLESVRPAFLRVGVGLSSENAAHRIAVQWSGEAGERKEGVFIPRRDTNSPLVAAGGGRVFPGEQHRAIFKVQDDDPRISISMRSSDGRVEVRLRAHAAANLSACSRFANMSEASSFFEQGSVGYSATGRGDRLDGLELYTKYWHVEPLDVDDVYSSFFADEHAFPRGSVEFDSALIMRNVQHEWRALGPMGAA